jgi:transcriptional regulator with XRE-family HTH domain
MTCDTECETMGQRIRRARKEMGLTQTHLAAKIGLRSQECISNWEKDKAEPSAAKIRLLCKVLNKTPDWIIGST